MTIYLDKREIPDWGDFWIGVLDQHLCYLKLPPEHPQEGLVGDAIPRDIADFAVRQNLTLAIRRVRLGAVIWGQLEEYLAGTRRQFDLPIRLLGTDFQRQVWQALQAIPWGSTRTYQDIAADLGNPLSARAVGQANGRNPISIVVPCHRVLAKNGLGGYSGGLGLKERLLRIEGVLGNVIRDGKGEAIEA